MRYLWYFHHFLCSFVHSVYPRGGPDVPFTALVIRLYSGWTYVSVRLGAEVVEYEESGAFLSAACCVIIDTGRWPNAFTP